MGHERREASVGPDGAGPGDDAVAASRAQRLVGALVPRSWTASMEAESRRWMVRCQACSFGRSIWELGGIRWKAKGTKWTWGRCPNCGKRGLHKIHHRDPSETPPEA